MLAGSPADFGRLIPEEVKKIGQADQVLGRQVGMTREVRVKCCPAVLPMMSGLAGSGIA